MAEYLDVAPEVVEAVGAICLALPEAYQEPAWTGTRWRIRKRTFAHVLAVEPEVTSAHVRAAGAADADGPVVMVTFRAAGPELEVLMHAGHPFFYAGWGRDVVGMLLDDGTDWAEVAELLTESYCVLAPRKLVALVDRPSPS